MSQLDPALLIRLREALARHELLAHFDEFAEVARLTFLMRVSPVDSGAVPLGGSRLGGTPDLPAGGPWPRNPDDDKLLDFIGQVNLAELPRAGQTLPEAGLLLLFSQQEGAAENPHAIQFVEAPLPPLTRAPVPAADEFSDEDTDEPFGALRVTEFIPSVSLPDFLEFPGLDDGDYDAYAELLQELHDDPGQQEPTSRLLGYPDCPDGSPLPGDDWELLAQIESHFRDGHCSMNFWDAGCLLLMVPQSQLAACNFQESASALFSM